MSAEHLGRKNRIINSVKKGTFLIVPFLLFFIAIVLLSVWGFDYIIADNYMFNALINDVSATEKVTEAPERLSGYAPTVPHASVWATLTVEGWNRTEIPVYSADDSQTLKKGAGHWIGSRFCGENGKIVISAHVNSYFRDLENTKVGDMVTMNTVFEDGEVYGYRVTDIVIFHQDDPSLLQPNDGEETLVLYTCYPLKNYGKKRVQRIALVCEKVYGRTWVDED